MPKNPDYRSLLGLPSHRTTYSKWFRCIFLFRADEDYAMFEAWKCTYLAWFYRALLTPDATPKQRRVLGIAHFHRFAFEVGLWETDMEKNGKKKSSIAVDRWVSFNLSDDDKHTLANDAPAISEVVVSFGALVFVGYRLSLSWDSYSQACQASLVCVDPDAVNAGIGVSARHPDADMALITLMYKVQAMGDEPWDNWCRPTPVNNWG